MIFFNIKYFSYDKHFILQDLFVILPLLLYNDKTNIMNVKKFITSKYIFIHTPQFIVTLIHCDFERNIKMISYIKGIVVHIDENEVILENSGVGYRIFVSEATAAALLPKGEQRQLFTYMSVKEDNISLYGFCTYSELQLFHKLITVSGVGPKGGLSLLSQLSPNDIITAILTEDVKTLCHAQGIGKKMAQRLILELKDKFSISDTDITAFTDTSESENTLAATPRIEALEALVSLGYSRSEAIKSLEKIYTDTMSTSELLKAALKQLTF